MAVEENFPKERTGQFIYSTPRELLVIVASYLKRRNPNDSWIAFYPIVDRNFHVRLPESLKERERGSARGKVGVVLLPRFELVRMRITAKLVVSQKRNEGKRVHG